MFDRYDPEKRRREVARRNDTGSSPRSSPSSAQKAKFKFPSSIRENHKRGADALAGSEEATPRKKSRNHELLHSPSDGNMRCSGPEASRGHAPSPFRRPSSTSLSAFNASNSHAKNGERTKLPSMIQRLPSMNDANNEDESSQTLPSLSSIDFDTGAEANNTLPPLSDMARRPMQNDISRPRSSANEQAQKTPGPSSRLPKSKPNNRTSEMNGSRSSGTSHVNANGSRIDRSHGVNVPTINTELSCPPNDLPAITRVLNQVPELLTGLSNKQAKVMRDLIVKVNDQASEIAQCQKDTDAACDALRGRMDKKFREYEDRLNRQWDTIKVLQSENAALRQYVDGTNDGTIEQTNERLQALHKMYTRLDTKISRTTMQNDAAVEEPNQVEDDGELEIVPTPKPRGQEPILIDDDAESGVVAEDYDQSGVVVKVESDEPA